MELRLVIQARDHHDQEVVVDVRPDHLVSELATALAGRLGLTGFRRLHLPQTGAWLDPDQPVSAAGLRSGDRVVLAGEREGPAPGGRQPLADLVVAGGPDAGRRIPLLPGEHRVGGSRYSAVMLDDPALSRVHLVAAVAQNGGVTVRDAGSESGVTLAGRPVTSAVALRPGDVLVAGASLLAFEPHRQAARRRPAVDGAGRVPFNRPPRDMPAPPPVTFTVDAPPQRDRGYRLPLSTAIVPLAMGLVMWAFFKQVAYLLFMLLAPVMAAFSLLETGVGGRRRFRRERAAHRKRLAALDTDLGETVAALGAHLRGQTPDTAELAGRALALDPALWERRQDAPDWLLLRAGWADRPAGVVVEVGPGGEANLRAEAEAVIARHRTLQAAPLQVSLREAGVLGICGERTRVNALGRALGIQLATLHSPEDLVLAAAVPDDRHEEWRWLGWLPHVAAEPLAGLPPAVVSGRTAARALVERLLAVVNERREARMAFHGTTAERLGPTVVAFLDERAELPRGAAAVLLERGPAVGVHVIWLGESRQSLPGECGAVVDLRTGDRGVLAFPARGESLAPGGIDGVALDIATEVARALAPLRDVSASEAQAGIPRRVELMELLGLRGDPEGRIMTNWIADRSAPQQRQLTAVLGLAAGAEPLSVRLREDGPHALVGGMTGSGKSELLQSLVASLAIAHSPRSLNFLLVDYKGGAAFKDCVDLAHTVGFVTDLDGHLVNRALVSLRAELRRREELLREAGAKDLLDLERLSPDRTPPSLLIVVDEFAALAAELPEFVDGMVDVAQRGRSLGIHLLLATQRPQGVINDRIRANTNLRLSLRFSDEGESMDVIGTRDAARPGLPPGRSFARTGPGEVVEFQAGYVGARAVAVAGPEPVIVRDLGFGGAPVAVAGQPAAGRQEATDLVRLVAAVRSVNQALGIPTPRRPWLPTLPEVVALDTLPPARPLRPALGLLDDPAGQRQGPLDFDLEADGNLLVFGASGSGKTSLLRAIAVSAALAQAPADLHVYGLDFATRGLKALVALPHCGGVVSGDEPERVIRLLGMLRAEAERRKLLLAGSAAGTIGEHRRRAGGDRLPALLVLLDGYPGFVSAMENVDIGVHVDTLRELVAEGRPLGIAFVISADRQAGHLSALMASVGRRIVLRMASEEEYALCGVPRSLYAGARLPAGRGFTEAGYELHGAIAGDDPSGAGQAAAIAEVGARLRQRHGDGDAAPVRLLPSRVERRSLPRSCRPLEAVAGIEDARLEALRIDLEEGHFLVAGPRRSGRTTALATLVASLRESPRPPALHLLAPRRHSRLPGLGPWDSVAVGMDECAALVERIATAARAAGPGDPMPAVLVIDDGEDLADGGLPDLDWIAQRGQEHGLRLLVGVETHAAQRAFSGWLTQVLRERQGLLLDADPAVDGTMMGAVQLPRRRGAWPAGRAYLVRRGVVELVQVATD